MAGQGATTKKIAAMLNDSGWQVIYMCIPNTPHIGVVPIPTKAGVTAQRYPDILSMQGEIIRFSEVEISLTEDIAEKAIERFAEMRNSISSREIYTDWKGRVLELTGKDLPNIPSVICELVICSKLGKQTTDYVKYLTIHGINVICARDLDFKLSV